MKNAYEKNLGFTIVELLVVIVIIGILAAISVVAYNGIQNQARDATISTDFANFQRKAELFRVDAGRYPQSGTELEQLQMKFNKTGVATTHVNITYCTTSAQENYALLVLSTSGKRLYVTSEDGIREFSGANGWTGLDSNLKCSQVLTGSSYVAGGYVKADTSPWKAWAGI